MPNHWDTCLTPRSVSHSQHQFPNTSYIDPTVNVLAPIASTNFADNICRQPSVTCAGREGSVANRSNPRRLVALAAQISPTGKNRSKCHRTKTYTARLKLCRPRPFSSLHLRTLFHRISTSGVPDRARPLYKLAGVDRRCPYVSSLVVFSLDPSRGAYRPLLLREVLERDFYESPASTRK